MKVLRIKAFQETACYTKPFANKVTETYPLPPYATIKGMIHAVMKAEKLIPFSISVQGDYEAMMVDYRKTYLFVKSRFNMPVILDGLALNTNIHTDMTSMPLYSHLLFNVELVIHVRADEQIMADIWDAFRMNDMHLSLGRHEDLLRLDEVSMVQLEPLDLVEGSNLMHSMYIPAELVEEDERSKGIPYLLNWTYEIKGGIREWVRIPTLYFSKHTYISDDIISAPIYVDEDGYIVAWNQ